MRPFNRSAFHWRRPPLAVCLTAVASCGALASVLAAEVEYTPSMKDTMSLQDTMHRYHEGLDQHDNKLMASAFTEDGTLSVIVNGQVNRSVTRDQMAVGGLMGGGAPGAPGAGATPGGPPPGGPPPGASAAPAAGPGGSAPPAPGAAQASGEPGDLWHFTEIDSYFKFESPTRATHYAYWMDVHVHDQTHSSTLGVPGHYDDIFVKRHGRWLFLSRKIVVGTK